MSVVVSGLRDLVGSGAVLTPEELPDLWLQRLQGVFTDPGFRPCVVMPATVEELAAVVACAARQGWPLIPAGQGGHLCWGKPSPGVPMILSTARLNQLVDHAVGDLTLTAQAGMTLETAQGIVAAQGQWLPLQGSCGEGSTLGGLVATADSGSLRHRYGGVRDSLLGIEFVRADGERSKAGGRVVKNVAGYDLMKLLTGSYGSLGIITQVTFRCSPLPQHQTTLLLWGQGDKIDTVFQTLQASSLTPVAVDFLSTQVVQDYLKTPLPPETIALAVQFASLEAAVAAQLETLQQWGKDQGLEGLVLEDSTQTQFWQTMQYRGRSYQDTQNPGGRSARILCKIGVLPSAAAETLRTLHTLASQVEGTIARGLIHGGSGLGWIELEPDRIRFPVLQALRQHCQTHCGFLSILEGPVTLKQQIEVWGYTGNALSLMLKVKQAFDPQNLLSPQRFLG
jgi:glycolate oxidase FAD binding subunit